MILNNNCKRFDKKLVLFRISSKSIQQFGRLQVTDDQAILIWFRILVCRKTSENRSTSFEQASQSTWRHRRPNLSNECGSTAALEVAWRKETESESGRGTLQGGGPQVTWWSPLLLHNDTAWRAGTKQVGCNVMTEPPDTGWHSIATNHSGDSVRPPPFNSTQASINSYQALLHVHEIYTHNQRICTLEILHKPLSKTHYLFRIDYACNAEFHADGKVLLSTTIWRRIGQGRQSSTDRSNAQLHVLVSIFTLQGHYCGRRGLWCSKGYGSVGLIAVPVVIACHWISSLLTFKPSICHVSDPVLLNLNFISFLLLSVFHLIG